MARHSEIVLSGNDIPVCKNHTKVKWFVFFYNIQAIKLFQLWNANGGKAISGELNGKQIPTIGIKKL
jgi:hypothetical protein